MPSITPSYIVWTPDTKITLTNVPWNSDYRDIVAWGNKPENRAAYFNALARQSSVSAVFEKNSYARIDYPVRLEIPISDAYQYNYVRVQNPGDPNNLAPTEYFYFITGVEMLTPAVTLFHLQLDVWTTYRFNVKFGQAYVQRGHIGIANSNSFNNFGRDFLTVPEGLDTGNEYQTVHHVDRPIMNVVDGKNKVGSFSIIIASTVDLSGDYGTITNPKLNTAKGSDLQNLPSGVSYYRCDSLSNFRAVMNKLSGYPWISQGIINISMVPNIGRYRVKTNNIQGPLSQYLYELSGLATGQFYNMMQNWRDSPALVNAIPAKYRHLRKFFTSPYMMLELTTYNGAPLMLRPESWNDPHGWISERISIAAPNQRVMFMPVKYNAGRGSTVVEQEKDQFGNVVGFYDDNGDYLDAHTQVANMPSFALVNNGYLSVMAGQAHSLGYSRDSADWSQQRALRSNETSFDQATNSVQTSQANATVSRNADAYSTQQANSYAWQQMGLGAAGGIAGGAIGGPGALAGAVGHAAMGAAGTAVGNNNSNAQWGIRNSAGVASTQNNTSSAEFMRDTNKSYADFAARGDYENTIAGINAKVQDARLTQPSMSGQAGGEVFNLINGGVKLSLRFKMISYNAMCMIGDYWLRYGYAVNRFMVIDKLHVMEHFTYWKLSETYLIGTYLSEFHKQTIRGIFEAGVTVWANPDDIGVIDISDNRPLNGIVIPVDPDPADYVEPVDPLIPNLDDEDKMYLISVANNLYTVGKEYLADNATLQVPQSTSESLIGNDPINLTTTGFNQVLRLLNIPNEYVDRDTFLTENPDGIWSKSITVENAVGSVGEALDSVLSKLDALDAKIPNPA